MCLLNQIKRSLLKTRTWPEARTTNASLLYFPYSVYLFLAYFVGWGVKKLMRLDLLACLMDGAGNGSLALIKAACLAGFAHHNLRMDYAAVCGSQYFRNSDGKSPCSAWERLRRNVAPATCYYIGNCGQKLAAAH